MLSMTKRKSFGALAVWAAAAGWAGAQEPLVEVIPTVLPEMAVVAPPVNAPAPTTPPVAPATTSTPAPLAAPVNGVTAAPATVIAGSPETFRRGLYGGIEYLIFEFRDGPAPPLLQILPASAFPANGEPDASQAITVFGDSIRQHGINGLRAELGYWFNDSIAFEAVYTQFETKSKNFFIQSSGDPSIGRYYFDTTDNDRPNTYLIHARPGGPESGFIDIQAPVRLWGFETNIRTPGYSVFSDRTDYIVGFRYIDLSDSITIRNFVQFNNGSGLSFEGEDRFSAANQFYGGQVGFISRFDIGAGFHFNLGGKLAVGGVAQSADVSGYTVERVNGVITRTAVGNLLTQPSNIGSHDRGRFAVAPELILKLGYTFGSRLNVNIGYNLLAVSSVVRAGSVIDDNINPNQSPFLNPNMPSDENRPAFNFNGTDFWAQGLTLGINLSY